MEKTQNSIEVEGKTVKDAIKKALELLKVPRNAISVKIVCEEKKGLFGLDSAKPAKIIVSVNKEKRP
ncbi:MAG: Jag N-terminal domain-containing protein [Candidatus Omnitrophota bacterium]